MFIISKIEDVKDWVNPGPGYYDYMTTISGNGRFPLSGFKSVTVPSIKPYPLVLAKNIEERCMFFYRLKF